MKIHLLRSPEYPLADFDAVVSFLRRYGGPAEFVAVPSFKPPSKRARKKEQVDESKFFKQESVREVIALSALPEERWVNEWESLFRACALYREHAGIGENDLVILLTEEANEHNWFCSLDPADGANGFVHTGEWQYYIRCVPVYPVAYLVASLILKRAMFANHAELQTSMHQWPLGCMNDFCANKKEIILKLRTADICFDCMQRLSGHVDVALVAQVLRLFEGVRSGMLFHQNFRQNLKPSVLRILEGGTFLLEDYDKEIALYPLEKTIYLFFLLHPEGVLLTHLADHKEELKQLYGRFTTTGLLPSIQRSINDLVNVNSGSAMEKITKINKKLREAMGEELGKHYIIGGERGEKRRVALERSYFLNDLL